MTYTVDLVEAVHVQLPDEGGEVGMLVEAGKNGSRELLLVEDQEGFTVRSPIYEAGVVVLAPREHAVKES